MSKHRNTFNDWLDAASDLRPGGGGQLEDWAQFRDAAVFVRDTLDVCELIASELLKRQATLDETLKVYDRFVQRMATQTNR